MPDRRFLDAHMRTAYARAQAVGDLLVRAGTVYGWESDEFVTTAVDAVLAGQTEQARASWEYLATAVEQADPLGRTLEAEAPVELMIGAATHDGAPLETVYRRPGKMAAEFARDGLLQSVIQERVSSEVVLMADADIATAGRKAEQVYGVVDRRIVGWRRVPNVGACRWCRYIATQRYKKEELAPAHRNCHCGTEPILGKTDPGPVFDKKELDRIKREGVPKRAGQRKATSRRANTSIDRFGETVDDVLPEVITDPTDVYGTLKDRDEIAALFNERNPGSTFKPGGWDAKTSREFAATMEDLRTKFPLAEGHEVKEIGNLREVFPRKKISRGVQGLAQAPTMAWDTEDLRWVFQENSYSYPRIGVATGSTGTSGAKMATAMKEAGWWSTDAANATLVHEYGHQVGFSAEMTLLKREIPKGATSNALAKNRYLNGAYEAKALVEFEVRSVLAELGGLDAGSVSWRDLVPTITSGLSEYAATNAREVVAESFAEYYAKGAAARPIARAVTERMLALIEEGKGLS